MSSIYFKKILPHVIAILCFLLVAAWFCRPVLEGQVLNQGDIVGWKGMAQNAFEYKEKNGHFPLWNTHLFSGMPNYQVAMEGDSIMPNFVKILSLNLPKPINFLFLAALCFFILTQVMRLSPWIGLFGGLAYMLSTYNPIIIGAGHESKMWALAFLPLMFAGILALFEKRYWLGTALTTFGIYQQIGVNHFQITYYGVLIAAAIFFSYLVTWIKKKEWKHTGRVLAIGICAGLLGLAGNALILMTTSEYAPFTMRGGKNIDIKDTIVTKTKTTGLDNNYAFQYSLGKAETVVLAMPDAFGGSTAQKLNEESNVIKKLTDQGVSKSDALQVAEQMPNYWGGIVEGTSGPPYVGAITCILALIGFVLSRNPIRWGLLAVSIFSILLSWGKYLPSLNEFLFEYLPLYNKFRAPSMALTIVEFTLPFAAVLALHQIFFTQSPDELKKRFSLILYTAGGSLAALLLLGLLMDYSTEFDTEVMNFAFDPSGSKEINQLIVSGLKEDRQDMFMGQVWRYGAFLFVVVALIYIYIKNWWTTTVEIIAMLTVIFTIIASSGVLKNIQLKNIQLVQFVWSYGFFVTFILGFLYLYARIKAGRGAIVIVLTLFLTIDLFTVGKKYLNEDAYVDSSTYETQIFNESPIDQELKKEADQHFRVVNLLQNPSNESSTSYFHRSIGGYHPAKLRIYQDLLERYLEYDTISQHYIIDSQVLDMLDTRFLIEPSVPRNYAMLTKRPTSFGATWLVKGVRIATDPADALQSIGTMNLRDSAIVEFTEDKSKLPNIGSDTTARIGLTRYDNDTITYSFESNAPQFAVFSEIYYPKGWNAYIDGKAAPYFKTNYVLRGMPVPAGKHEIKFIFEPSSYKTGNQITYASSILILLIVLGSLFMAVLSEWRKKA